MSSIPGLPQWVKDQALLRAAAKVTDVDWIQCCHGCGVGQQIVMTRPLAGEFPYAAGAAVKRKKILKRTNCFLYIYRKTTPYKEKTTTYTGRLERQKIQEGRQAVSTPIRHTFI